MEKHGERKNSDRNTDGTCAVSTELTHTHEVEVQVVVIVVILNSRGCCQTVKHPPYLTVHDRLQARLCTAEERGTR